MPPLALGAAASAAAAAWGTWKYNRENYLGDNAPRFARYVAGYTNAISQAKQYREDIHDMTNNTTTKMDVVHTVGTIFFVLNFQLIMAGRLGVHGPSPPGWLLAIYWSNISMALMYLATFTWLSMHCSARCAAGGAFMLTRNVRLPIPTPQQLDKARVTGNCYEKTRVTDMLRVPFIAPAAKDEATYDKVKVDPKAGDPWLRKHHDGVRKIPRWYQDECAELHAGTGGPVQERSGNMSDFTPEHFELYRGLQQEWWGHEAYARIGMTCYMSHWLTAVSLYSQSHCFGELRALWPAWSVTMIFCTAHYMLLWCEVHNDVTTRMHGLPMEKIVPWTPMLCVLAMSLDYSIIPPSQGWVIVIYVISCICYAIHYLWAWRLYDLCSPPKDWEKGNVQDMDETAGHAWIPCEWPMPRAFMHMVYIVAPPKQVEYWNRDIQQEMRAGKWKGKNTTASPKKQKQAPVGMFAWKIFRGALITMIAIWTLIILGRFIEMANGERAILKQEGRVERWPSHMQPWMPPWSRLDSRNEWCHTGGCDRRLTQHGMLYEHNPAEEKRQRRVATAAKELAEVLGPLAEALEAPQAVAPTLAGPPTYRAKVLWPLDLQPAVLASGGNGAVAALARSRQGAMLRLAPGATTPSDLSHFVFHGIDSLVGDVLGASWGESGLLLATAGGGLAECAGLPIEGAWACTKIAMQLPMGGASSLAAAVAARMPGTGRLRSAVTFHGEPDIVVFDWDEEAGSWLPVGEVQLPYPASKVPAFSMSPVASELLIATGNGAVLRWPIGAHEPVMISRPQPTTSSKLVWHSACHVSADNLVHLASRHNVGSAVSPELVFSTALA